VDVARRAAAFPQVAAPLEPQHAALIHTRGDAHVQAAPLPPHAVAGAAGAGQRKAGAAAAAGRAGGGAAQPHACTLKAKAGGVRGWAGTCWAWRCFRFSYWLLAVPTKIP
jgi:hypothetical protein